MWIIPIVYLPVEFVLLILFWTRYKGISQTLWSIVLWDLQTSCLCYESASIKRSGYFQEFAGKKVHQFGVFFFTPSQHTKSDWLISIWSSFQDHQQHLHDFLVLVRILGTRPEIFVLRQQVDYIMQTEQLDTYFIGLRSACNSVSSPPYMNNQYYYIVTGEPDIQGFSSEEQKMI